MNKFANTQPGGILKDSYGDESMSPLHIALKRKLMKMRQDIALKADSLDNDAAREFEMTKRRKQVK